MDWNTLLSVALGGLIATIGSIINNRYQASERKKERDEARREAKIQTREKWIESDVRRIMDSVEILLKMHSELPLMNTFLKSLQDQVDAGFLTQDEAVAKLKTHYQGIDKFQEEMHQTMDIISTLAHSLEDQGIESNVSNLVDAFEEFIEHITGEPPTEIDDDIWDTVRQKAGTLRKSLRDKMIKIRDS